MFVSWFYAVCVLILLNSENKKPSIQLPDTHLLISESGGQSLSSHPRQLFSGYVSLDLSRRLQLCEAHCRLAVLTLPCLPANENSLE